jgi:ubiquinone/menaquinone biosynthesis C-methylase UbiE
MTLQILSTSLSNAEFEARDFYDRWIGKTGLVSFLGRLVFGLSGVVYSRTFVRVVRLTPADRVVEIGCGMGTILAAAQRQVCSEESYLGIDLSYQMILQGRKKASRGLARPLELMVGSALSLPVESSLFDVVLLSHVVKYLTEEQLRQALLESARVLKPGGRIVLWEFSPVLTPLVTRLVLKYCRAQKLRPEEELRQVMETSGFGDLRSFRITTPWLPWSNVALTGKTNGSHNSHLEHTPQSDFETRLCELKGR